MTGACGISGGIASNNLNIIFTLTDLVKNSGKSLAIYSLLESDLDRPDFLQDWVKFKGFQGKKFKFARTLLSTLTLSSTNNIYFFDHVSLAKPLLPLSLTGLIKTVIFAHGSESWKRLSITNRLLFKFATLVLTNSNFTLNKMRRISSSFNGVACPLGLPPSFKLNSSVPENSDHTIELESADGEKNMLGKRVLLLVARMHPHEREKGHIQLMKILPELLKEFPEVQLVFPGTGDDLSYLKAQAMKLKIGSRVFSPGHVCIDTLQRLYHQCYAYIMPSTQEGFGLTYLEAMNFGKPCVGCFNQGAEDVIIHKETGYLIHNPNDFEELKTTVQKLLHDPLNAKKLGINGFNRLHSYFTASSYQARLKDHLSEILC